MAEDLTTSYWFSDNNLKFKIQW